METDPFDLVQVERDEIRTGKWTIEGWLSRIRDVVLSRECEAGNPEIIKDKDGFIRWKRRGE